MPLPTTTIPGTFDAQSTWTFAAATEFDRCTFTNTGTPPLEVVAAFADVKGRSRGERMAEKHIHPHREAVSAFNMYVVSETGHGQGTLAICMREEAASLLDSEIRRAKRATLNECARAADLMKCHKTGSHHYYHADLGTMLRAFDPDAIPELDDDAVVEAELGKGGK